MASLSVDLRERVVAAYRRGGHTYITLAAAFGIGVASVSRWLRLERETGALAPRKHGGGNPGKLRGEDGKRFRALVEAHPDWTAQELALAWKRQTGEVIHMSTAKRALARMGFTHKKSRSGPRKSDSRPSRASGASTRRG